ncbi:MAG: ATP-binding protein [Saprospiraceae bacterium]|nr:ATP-binding protein [Saprospiraceae bacterium]
MLKLASCSESICELEQFVRNLSEQYNICPDRYPDILISLTEAVNNAIIHGNGECRSKNVLVVHSYQERRGLTFKVSDEGSGFDYASIPDPTKVENLERIGGRGVFLMKQLSDRIKFENNGRTVIINFNV